MIGRDGVIEKLFVGGGPKLGDQLREAIQAALGIEQPVQNEAE